VEFDDELDDDGPGPPLLPADDRLWRHPSEVGHALIATGWRRYDTRVWTVGVLAASIGALLATGVTYVARSPGTRTVTVPAFERNIEPVSVLSVQNHFDVMAVTRRVRPAVASLIVTRGVTRSSGSGVVFRSDGFLLTSASVVTGASQLTAVLADDRRLTAKIVGLDPDSGIALLKLPGYGFEVASLGSTASVKTGQPAVVLGSPVTLNGVPAVSSGRVTGLGQNMDDGNQVLSDMIETDAHIDPGSWGGPLLDASGAVIGITDAPAGGDLIGADAYATPIELASAVAEQLITTGRVTPVWFGIAGADLDGGVVVQDVTASSPAARSGIDPGDVIIAVDDRPVSSMNALTLVMRTHRPGESILLRVRHNGEERTVSAVLEPRPSH